MGCIFFPPKTQATAYKILSVKAAVTRRMDLVKRKFFRREKQELQADFQQDRKGTDK
jgi:hypothetical protein